MDAHLLAESFECPLSRAQLWADPLSAAMALHAVDSRLRQAAFLAQIGHESGRLRYVKEIWGPTPTQLRYEGRKDLGNVVPGDGKKFMGRGLIQTTGRANFRRTSLVIFGDERLLDTPELLSEPTYAALSACVFWTDHKLNALADALEFRKITRIINGGYNGQADRQALYARLLTLIKE